MKVTVTKADGLVPVLALVGEFDALESDEIQHALARVLADGEPSLVVDLSEMSFANSTTIACFISAQKNAREKGGKIVLAAPDEFFHKTLLTLGLDQVFSIYGTVDDAHQAIG